MASFIGANRATVPRTQPSSRARVARDDVVWPWRGQKSVGHEAIEQAGTAGGHQVVLAAAARAVRGVPGLHMPRVLETGTVMVTDDGGAVGAFRPVPAGGVAAGGGEEALRVRPGQDVVLVGGIAAAVDDLALLGQRRLLGEIVRARVEILHALRHHHAFGVLPRTLADA